MKTVFMGTPDFAVPPLEALIKAGYEVGYVITQPDKAKNRGKKIQFTPVKETAVANGLKVLQPEKIKNSKETMEALCAYEPDIIVVAAYGQILQKELLELPRFGCINIHASLLPRFRGASPIQHAILQGDEKSGITIMQMAEGLDTGDMLAKAELEIAGRNCEQLHDALASLGAELLIKTLPKLAAGEIKPVKQDDTLSTYAGMITKQDGKLDFTKTAVELERQIRAFDPWPGAFCYLGDNLMKVWSAECDRRPETETDWQNGRILGADDTGIAVCCAGSVLRITCLQMPGKKRVEAGAYLRGNKIEKGTILR